LVVGDKTLLRFRYDDPPGFPELIVRGRATHEFRERTTRRTERTKILYVSGKEWQYCPVLNIMLCGASDTDDVLTAFTKVVTSFGAEPWTYLSGHLQYRNSARASWEGNSRRTVAEADICVFVIMRRYGTVTWTAELSEALDAGKPFILLCLQSTYTEYLNLTRNVQMEAISDPDKRSLLGLLTELESERQLTIVPFDLSAFPDVLRRETARTFKVGIRHLTARMQAESLVALLRGAARLTNRQLAAAEALAVDDFEDKRDRKLAISALIARRAASLDTVLALLASQEQGVLRYTISNLGALYGERPADQEFFNECITLANSSDDVGIARRLVPALFSIDVGAALEALENLDFTEIGTRRRVAQELEGHETQIRSDGLGPQALVLLNRCLTSNAEGGWLGRCRALMERLG